MDATMLSLVGCIIAFALLMILIMKNFHILIVALVCVTVVSLFSGMNVYTSIMEPYMTGFVEAGILTSAAFPMPPSMKEDRELGPLSPPSFLGHYIGKYAIIFPEVSWFY